MAGYTIVLDAMGGDNAPRCNVEGAILALGQDKDLKLVLTGKQDQLNKLLDECRSQGQTWDENRLAIVHTEEVIENEEHSPAEAVRAKRNSSLSVGCQMVRSGEADGMVSAGNTGAVLSGGTLLIGRIKGVQRPALTLPLPTGNPPTVMVDVGANMDAKASYLVQFARMSTIYFRELYGVEKPRVALLNVGVEEGKGTELTKEVYDLLKADEAINFIGNIEAREVLMGASDIVVCDAFAGNVFLKTVEGTAKFIMNQLKAGIKDSFKAKIGALLMKKTLKGLKNSLDPSSVGGTPLLGVKGALIKAHGNSDAIAIMNAIRQCAMFISTGVNDKIAESIRG